MSDTLVFMAVWVVIFVMVLSVAFIALFAIQRSGHIPRIYESRRNRSLSLTGSAPAVSATEPDKRSDDLLAALSSKGISPPKTPEVAPSSGTQPTAEKQPQGPEETPNHGVVVPVGNGWLAVTVPAARKLREAIESETTDANQAFRLSCSPETGQLRMVLGTALTGDRVVTSQDFNILFISPEALKLLEGVVVDYKDAPDGGFVLSHKSGERVSR